MFKYCFHTSKIVEIFLYLIENPEKLGVKFFFVDLSTMETMVVEKLICFSTVYKKLITSDDFVFNKAINTACVTDLC